jgi:hypothetical protein
MKAGRIGQLEGEKLEVLWMKTIGGRKADNEEERKGYDILGCFGGSINVQVKSSITGFLKSLSKQADFKASYIPHVIGTPPRNSKELQRVSRSLRTYGVWVSPQALRKTKLHLRDIRELAEEAKHNGEEWSRKAKEN